VRRTQRHISIRLCVSWAYQRAYQKLGILVVRLQEYWLRFMLCEKTEPGQKCWSPSLMERESRWWTLGFSLGWLNHASIPEPALDPSLLDPWALVATRQTRSGIP
jgi:hypothetical protein